MPTKQQEISRYFHFFVICIIVGGIGGCLAQKQDMEPPQTSIPALDSLQIPGNNPTVLAPAPPFPQTVAPSGEIAINGSVLMSQTNRSLKASIEKRFPGAIISANTQGTDIGIQELLSNKVNVAAISRPLTDGEKQQGLVEVPVEKDEIVIIVAADNPFRRGLTQEQLGNIFAGKITNWSAVKGANIPIKVIYSRPINGVPQIFKSLILRDSTLGIGSDSLALNQDSISSILNKLNKDAISYANYSQVINIPNIRIVPIDGLVPEAENYPYRQILYYAYRQPVLPQVKFFLDYATSPQGKKIIELAKFNNQKSEERSPRVASQPNVSPSPDKKLTSSKKSTSLKIQSPTSRTKWETKKIRGIYLSRYQATNNADEDTIRARVRYYRAQGFNTIIHGVWGNGCTMYNSEVMANTFGFKSCLNLFNDRWLDWLIDEAHKQGMEVHAYFEKGIKIDKNSPIYDHALAQRWIVPGVDKTYVGVDHYVLDVAIPEVAALFQKILVEFVQKYPRIDAVQWDDYLGYHAELSGNVDRTKALTQFLQQMIHSMKKVDPSVSFDLCHHNPYWAKRYFAADWEKWDVDRVFIQAYNEKNFKEELKYAQRYAGIAITDRQFHRLNELINNPKVNAILVFPFSGNPEKTASTLNEVVRR